MSFADLHMLTTQRGPLWVQRAWPRSDEHVLLELGTANGEPVGGQWLADPVRRHELLSRIGGKAFEVPDTGVVVQFGGADRRLPGLAPLLAEPGAALVSHRPERRAVVRQADGAFVKVVRPGRSAEVVAAAARAAEAAGEWFAVPRLLHHDPERGLLVWSALPGETLHDRVRAGRGVRPAGWTDTWERVGVAVRHLHAASPAGRPARTLADEWRSAQRWLVPARSLGLLPDVPDDAVLPVAPPGPVPAATVHGDLHDKQLMVDGLRCPGILDVDTLAAGDPALDIANLVVHLRLRVSQGLMRRDLADRAQAAFLSGYAPDAATIARLPAYGALVLLRLAGLYAFRPRWRGLAAALAASVDPAPQDRHLGEFRQPRLDGFAMVGE